MPVNWTLKTNSGRPVDLSVVRYETYPDSDIVTSFAVELDDGIEVFMLAPHGHSQMVGTFFREAFELVGIGRAAKAGYKMGSPRGVLKGLGGGAIGIVVASVATKAIDKWFPDEPAGGFYYDYASGEVVFSGLIRADR